MSFENIAFINTPNLYICKIILMNHVTINLPLD